MDDKILYLFRPLTLTQDHTDRNHIKYLLYYFTSATVQAMPINLIKFAVKVVRWGLGQNNLLMAFINLA